MDRTRKQKEQKWKRSSNIRKDDLKAKLEMQTERRLPSLI